MSARVHAPDPGPMPHEAHLVVLASLDGVGPGRMRWLLSHGTPAVAWDAVVRRRLGVPPPRLQLTPGILDAWAAQARSLDPALAWAACEAAGIGVVSLGGAGYPPRLVADADPPVVLFHRGDPDVVGAPTVAIVGTRRATGYGLRTARLLGQELSEHGVAVVSGLALGIDAAAHRGAVAAMGAPPVAVVGGGLDAPCPARNRTLANEVARRGVLLSEVPPGVAAAPWRFPVRNRILAALADVVVVVESAGAGGSMHTVREALVRDRPVLAVPGPIDSRSSEGTNQLLSEGAHPCTSTADVLVALGRTPTSPGRGSRAAAEPDPRPAPTGTAAAVLEGLGWRPASPDQLAGRSGLDFRSLSAALAVLEADGWIERRGGWIERVARPPIHEGPRGDA